MHDCLLIDFRDINTENVKAENSLVFNLIQAISVSRYQLPEITKSLSVKLHFAVSLPCSGVCLFGVDGLECMFAITN